MYLCSLRAPQSPLRLFSRDVTVWLFRLYWILFPEMSQVAILSLLEDSSVFVLDCAPQFPLRLLLQRCYRLVISSLLDNVSRDVPSGYSVSAGGFPCICARLVHHSLPLRLFSRDVTGWLFRLYWILFPEMSQLASSSLLEDSECICARLVHRSLV